VAFSRARGHPAGGISILAEVHRTDGAVTALEAASLRTGGAVDVMVGWIDDSDGLGLASFRPCLCE